MDQNQFKGPFCQSCGMPLREEEDFGVNADGTKNQDYCHFCFLNGQFRLPNISMERMIDKVAEIMARQINISGAQAKKMAKSFIPKLKRWC